MSGLDIEGARCAVFGATGEIGGLVARELASAGGRMAVAGRDSDRLERVGLELSAPTARFDITDPNSREEAVIGLAKELGGFDLVVVSVGRAAFAPAGSITAEDVDAVFGVNATGPIALIDSALEHLDEGGALAAITGMVAEFPTAGLPHYSAAKAALSAYLAAAGREQRRRGVSVLDVRPSHVETGFAERSLFGEPPKMPQALDPGDVAREIVDALRAGERSLAWKPGHGEPNVAGRERTA
ncbi:SDR family oxidoreductase [Thermoleophilia bacterium SCSIO 60948]|nr:SDR family oxidoreductase [Thermoleophilia bacterium SCSIO 60948]